MAPEPSILKRKRSRPSDYWVVRDVNVTPQRNDDDAPPVVKDGEKRSLSDATQTAAGNRGRPAKGAKDVVVSGEEGENHEAHLEGKTPRRGGRSSGTATDLRVEVPAGSSKAAPGVRKSKLGPSTKKTNPNSGNRTKGSKKSAQQSTVEEADQLAPVEVEVPATVQKRRARPSLTKFNAPVVTQDQAEMSSKPVRGGRSGAAKPAVEDELALEVQGSAAKSGLDQSEDIHVLEQKTGNSSKRKSTRISDARLSQSDNLLSAPSQDRKVQRRTRQSDTQPQVVKSPATLARTEESSRKRTRSDTAVKKPAKLFNKAGKIGVNQLPHVDIEVETASSKLTKAKSKPSASSRKSSQGNAPKNSSVPQASGKAGGSRTTVSKKAPPRQSVQKASSSTQTQGRKRKEIVGGAVEKPSKRQRIDDIAHDEEIVPEISERNPYPHLEPTTRRVSRLKIESKWEPLPPGCIEQISTLLSELQKPVIARLKEDRKKSQASVALKSVSRKLVKKLSRGLPFPLATSRTREDDFDFEKILDHSRALEFQLTPAIHANELLEAELRKEMARLESDQQNLADLEANAKKEAALRNDGSRGLHSLLHADVSHEESNFQLDVGLEDKKVYQSLDKSITDEHLQELINNLSDHMNSIQGNIKQVDGITEGLAKAKGAVQARLFDHLDSSQYESVVLGSNS